MEHDGCVGCKYEHESADSKYCLGCKQNAIDKYAPMTNADRIRSMTDEELAEWIYSIDYHYDDDNGASAIKLDEVYINDRKEDILDWLQEKAGD